MRLCTFISESQVLKNVYNLIFKMGHKACWLLEARVSVSWVEQVIYIWFRHKGIRNASRGQDWKQKH